MQEGTNLDPKTKTGETLPEAELTKSVSSILGVNVAPEETAKEASATADIIKKSKVSPIRTFKSDASTFIQEEHIGKIEMIAAEAVRNTSKKFEEEFGPQKKVNPILLILVIVTLGVGGFLLYLVFGSKLNMTPTKARATIPAPLIFSEKQSEIILKDGLQSELAGEIKRKIQQPFPRENLVYVPILRDLEKSEEYIGVKQFLEIAKLDPPADLTQALEERYMFALFSKGERYPVLIFKVKFYNNAFAGMISWENSLLQSIEKIWPIKKWAKSDQFKDITVENHDARKLEDAVGNLVLLYSFVDRETLVITTNEDTLKEIIKRAAFR